MCGMKLSHIYDTRTEKMTMSIIINWIFVVIACAQILIVEVGVRMQSSFANWSSRLLSTHPHTPPWVPESVRTCTRVSCASIVCFWRRVRDCAEIPRRPCRRRAAHGVRIQTRGVDDDCFDYFKISLVSLVEGLCSLDSSLRCYVFRKKKYLKEKKQLLQSLIPSPSPSICIPMCTLYTYTNTYMLRFSSSGFSGSKTGCWCQVDSSSVYAQ